MSKLNVKIREVWSKVHNRNGLEGFPSTGRCNLLQWRCYIILQIASFWVTAKRGNFNLASSLDSEYWKYSSTAFIIQISYNRLTTQRPNGMCNVATTRPSKSLRRDDRHKSRPSSQPMMVDQGHVMSFSSSTAVGSEDKCRKRFVPCEKEDSPLWNLSNSPKTLFPVLPVTTN